MRYVLNPTVSGCHVNTCLVKCSLQTNAEASNGKIRHWTSYSHQISSTAEKEGEIVSESISGVLKFNPRVSFDVFHVTVLHFAGSK
jgi:hypothetical protein